MVSPALQRGEKGFHKFVTESRRDGAKTLFTQEPIAAEGMQAVENTFPQGLKLRPFKADEFFT